MEEAGFKWSGAKTAEQMAKLVVDTAHTFATLDRHPAVSLLQKPFLVKRDPRPIVHNKRGRIESDLYLGPNGLVIGKRYYILHLFPWPRKWIPTQATPTLVTKFRLVPKDARRVLEALGVD